MSKIKLLGAFVLTALPSLFMVLWTASAALVPGADVFVIALLQIVFIGAFFGYTAR